MKINDREIKSYKIIEDKDDILKKGTDKDKDKVLVVDFDDTLALSAYKHYQMMLTHKNVELYKQYMNLQPMSIRFFYSRNKYYTTKWLMKPGVDKLPEEIEKEIKELFCDPNFYDDVQPTKYAISLKEYLKQDYCKKIYVVSHCLSDASIQGKIKWLAEFFKDCNPEKIEFIPTKDTRKAIPIMEHAIKWDIFVDDRLECIYDMVLYGQGFGNEILIPEAGYNKPDNRFSELVKILICRLFI